MKKQRSGLTLIETLVVVAIISILAGLVLQTIQSSRNSAHQASCSNNLSQIGRGLLLHESTFGTFPPRSPAIANSPGASCSYEGIGWQVYLLPFIGQSSLFDQVVTAYEANPDPFPYPNLAQAELHVKNSRVIVPTFVCPQDSRLFALQTDPDRIEAGFLSYAGVTGYTEDYFSGVFGRRQGVTLAQIQDGLSNTLAIGERPPPDSYQTGWWYTAHSSMVPQPMSDFECAIDSAGVAGQASCSADSVIVPGTNQKVSFYFRPGFATNPCDRFHYWSLHSGGGNFLYCDGSVKFTSYNAGLFLRNLATISGSD